jgi:pyruvate,orthophosphate dikinase
MPKRKTVSVNPRNEPYADAQWGWTLDSTTHVYDFEHCLDLRWSEVVALLGGKGAGLNRMARHSDLRDHVPHGFTIATTGYHEYVRNGLSGTLANQVNEALERLEEKSRLSLGDPDRPLLLSVRSGAPVSMPGQLETVLNVGITSVIDALFEQDSWWALDSHRTFLEGYARAVARFSRDDLDRVGADLKGHQRHEWTVDDLRALNIAYAHMLRNVRRFPAIDNRLVLDEIIGAVFQSWESDQARRYRENPRERIPHSLGTAVNIQAMVFGNRNQSSGTGVLFTRNKDTGANTPLVEYAPHLQGEGLVSGTTDPAPHEEGIRELERLELWRPLIDKGRLLEEIYRDACDVEFTVDDSKLFLLQVRPAERSGEAALRIAVDLATKSFYEDGRPLLPPDESLRQLKAEDVARLLNGRLRPRNSDVLLARGETGASGAAKGAAVFSVRAAEHAQGNVILIRPKTVPEETSAMGRAMGYVTRIGGRFSHAALVATKWGKPAVVGVKDLRIDPSGTCCVFVKKTGDKDEEITVYEGETVSIDGSTGEIYRGDVEIESKPAAADILRVCEWAADALTRAGDRPRLGVRVNAETRGQIEEGLRHGASGVGMVRTEEMPDVAPVLHRLSSMRLAPGSEVPDEIAKDFLHKHTHAFRQLMRACQNRDCPLAIRLLDTALLSPQLLPPSEPVGAPEEEEEGTTRSFAAALTAVLEAEPRRTEYDVNPLSTRGVRIGVLFEELYRLQIEALFTAASELLREGYRPKLELIIPMVIATGEVELVRRLVNSEKRALSERSGRVGDVSVVRALEDWQVGIGAMVETPRAVMIADRLTQLVEFFTLGTNDLTQMVYGFDQEEVGGPLLQRYFDAGILTVNPFESLDDKAVLPLLEVGIGATRSASLALDRYVEIGLAGDHGGDPRSIRLLANAGIDYVSCRPERVPIALLTAAHVAIDRRRRSGTRSERGKPVLG